MTKPERIPFVLNQSAARYLINALPVFFSGFWLIAGLFCSFHSRATEINSDLEIESRLQEIASSSYWHKLLHYKKFVFSNGYQSEITDYRFFLSKEGSRNAYEELAATLDAFKTDPNAVCRFPARYHWLSAQYGAALNLDAGKLERCEELKEWEKTINPGSATLVFPAAFLNGPSSMFGHTLLRIEPDDERKNLSLITYAINYAANVRQSDNDFAFALKGIFGGYPGIMAIVPYHQKIKEYGEIESRDIWEYRLKLSKPEIYQMLRHAWELKDLQSAYYFFDLNCSYLILNLIEVARDDINLTQQFRYKVIPIDTVKAVVDAGLVNQTDYRPAAATQLAQHYEELNQDQKQHVEYILQNQPGLEDYSHRIDQSVDYARVLEVVYDTNRYRAFEKPSERDNNADYNLKLLTARSQIDAGKLWQDVKVPQFKPEEGHGSARLAAGVKRRKTTRAENYLFLKIRPAYHDLLDPSLGFPEGAQINFLDFQFSYGNESHDLELERLSIIDIMSISPRHDLFKPTSWRVDFSYEKRIFSSFDVNVLQVVPAFGVTARLGKGLGGYALAGGALEYSNDYTDDYALGTNVQSGLSYTGQRYSGLIEVSANRFFSGERDTRFSALIGCARHINRDFSVRAELQREKLYEHYLNTYQLSVNWYF